MPGLTGCGKMPSAVIPNEVRNPELILNAGEVGIFSLALPEFHSIKG
jgi:hypothetical protein